MHSAAKTLTHTGACASAQKTKRAEMARIFPYAVAALAVAAAATISYPLRTYLYVTPLFFAAVVVSCWYAGTGAGVFAALVSTAAIHFLMHLPRHSFPSEIQDLLRLFEFAFIATVAIFLIAARKRAEQSLRRARDELEIKVAERTAVACASEKKLRNLIETIPAMAFVTRPDGANEFVSRQWIEFSGFSSVESAGAGWAASIHHDDLEQHAAKWRAACASGEPFESESRHRDVHGNYRWLLVRAVPLRNEQGEIRKWYGTAIDIEDRKRAEALLAGEKRLLEMIATGVPFKEIANALCQIIEQQRPGTLASVLLLNCEGVHLDVIAGPNLPGGWDRQMEQLPIGPCAGSCGTAAYRGSPVIVSDIATDPLWDLPEHRASALEHGLRASWSNPVLSSEGKVLGTFCMYYRETRSPNSQDLELIDLATDLVRIAIERDRTEKALRASEQVARGQVEALTYSLDVLATAPAPDKFLGQMLSTIGRLLGAQSVILWLLDESNDALVLRSWAEGTNFAKGDLEHPFIKNPSSWKEDPGLRELFFSGAPVACEDVEHDPFTSNDLREYLKAGGTKKFLRIPTLVGGRVTGFIGIRHGERPPYRPEEIELAQALAHQAMLAIQLNKFAEQSRQAAVLEERNRMALDIHDTLAQGFTGVIVQLESAEDAMACCRRKETNEHLRRASELARHSLNEARRSVHALRPEALQRDNFWEALKGIVKNTTGGTSLHTRFELRGRLRRLSPMWQENLLHIGQEALTNALKHAHPRNFETRLIFNSKAFRLELRDDGNGLRVKQRHDGLGLAGMRERAEQMGGTLKVASARGKGTTIVVTVPYPPPDGFAVANNHESRPRRNDGFQAVKTVRA